MAGGPAWTRIALRLAGRQDVRPFRTTALVRRRVVLLEAPAPDEVEVLSAVVDAVLFVIVDGHAASLLVTVPLESTSIPRPLPITVLRVTSMWSAPPMPIPPVPVPSIVHEAVLAEIHPVDLVVRHRDGAHGGAEARRQMNSHSEVLDRSILDDRRRAGLGPSRRAGHPKKLFPPGPVTVNPARSSVTRSATTTKQSPAAVTGPVSTYVSPALSRLRQADTGVSAAAGTGARVDAVTAAITKARSDDLSTRRPSDVGVAAIDERARGAGAARAASRR